MVAFSSSIWERPQAHPRRHGHSHTINPEEEEEIRERAEKTRIHRIDTLSPRF